MLAAVIALPASGSGWCFSGRQAEQKQAGNAGTRAEGAAGEGAGKGGLGYSSNGGVRGLGQKLK